MTERAVTISPGEEPEALLQRIAALEQENRDLEIALLTAVEHGDAVENTLLETNSRLAAEIRDRVQAEVRLHTLVTAISQQRSDLEILLRTITEHSDRIDLEWLSRYNQMEELSRLDGLTQISNRRNFDATLEREWRRCARQQHPLSVLMIDVDRFKEYNDHYGHQAGDECLATLAQLLERVCRGPADLPARYGGEEFAVLLPERDLDGALALADELARQLKEEGIVHQGSVTGTVTISIGAACRRADGAQSPWEVVVEADRWLYVAKHKGRNRIVHAGNAQAADGGSNGGS
jgi:diguanylate cyclase (GGDEF)-like protein